MHGRQARRFREPREKPEPPGAAGRSRPGARWGKAVKLASSAAIAAPAYSGYPQRHAAPASRTAAAKSIAATAWRKLKPASSAIQPANAIR